MDLQLTNKVIIVTGGAKGIGAAIVRAAANEGAVPVIVDQDAEAGVRLQKELTCEKKTASFVHAQLGDVNACVSAIKKTADEFGHVDALVNNAGRNDKVGLELGSPQKFVESVSNNLLHYYNMAHYALPHLKQTRGCIVNIASKTAVTGQGGTSGYVAAKGAILGLTREWAAELLNYGVRVNAILPAEVMTPLYQQWLDSFPSPEDKLKTILDKIPLEKRMTTAEEIAATAIFLISGKSGHTTGQYIFVDGGYTHLDRALT